jgi:hypothetical protein
MNFKEKVQSMTAKEIILSMVEGLEEPKVKVDMHYYGHSETTSYFFGLFSNTVCFGCAATNAICKISGITFDKSNIDSTIARAKAVGSEIDFFNDFEYAINALRCGEVEAYNKIAVPMGMASIVKHISIPHLTNSYTKNELSQYRLLAEMQ